MSLTDFIKEARPFIEHELKHMVDTVDREQYPGLHEMLAYHMGWEGDDAGEKAQGKRIRPVLVLLATSAACKDWKKALPASAAIELIHNFSLIHDDIEDKSEYRHGRKTVWAKWGEPQAINAGDCMYSLAYRSLVQSPSSPENLVTAISRLEETCIRLTKGQYLDMAFETESQVTAEMYWNMVGGKTAALLACSAVIGAIVTGVDTKTIDALQVFAWNLGLAFQAQDDWLGIWGDAALMGKSTESDLMSGKKSLPILLGLSSSRKFREHWAKRPFRSEEISELAQLLIDEGIQKTVEIETSQLTTKAKTALDSMPCQNEAVRDLHELADLLLVRKK